jgi:hypothetical protein
MHQIQGPLQVNVGNQYVYSVIPADGLTYTWTVSGCNILSGQGTPSITILWTFLGQGSIQVDVVTTGGDDIVVIDPTAG